MKKVLFGKYGYLWVTLGFFLFSLIGHWVFAWFAYVEEQRSIGAPIEVYGYLVGLMRDTFENWQSEFLQLMWQVAGLAILWHVGSPQSKEGDERKEAKIDAILRATDTERAESVIKELDVRYPRT